jgi:hypothetical protein
LQFSEGKKLNEIEISTGVFKISTTLSANCVLYYYDYIRREREKRSGRLPNKKKARERNKGAILYIYILYNITSSLFLVLNDVV